MKALESIPVSRIEAIIAEVKQKQKWHEDNGYPEHAEHFKSWAYGLECLIEVPRGKGRPRKSP